MLSKTGIEKQGVLGASSAQTLKKVKALVSQLCLTLRDPMDCNSPPGSSVHGLLQGRILEWVAISFSEGRGSSQSPIEPGSPALQMDSFLSESPGEPCTHLN